MIAVKIEPNGIPNTPLVSTKKPRPKTASGHLFAIKLDDIRNSCLVEIEGIGIPSEDEQYMISSYMHGNFDTLRLKDGGILIVHENYKSTKIKKPLNRIATALSGTQVFGEALIVGQENGMLTDVPMKYYALLAFDLI